MENSDRMTTDRVCKSNLSGMYQNFGVRFPTPGAGDAVKDCRLPVSIRRRP